MESDFMECSECFTKPGTPVLCAPCRSNRDLITALSRRITTLKNWIRNTGKVELNQEQINHILGDS